MYELKLFWHLFYLQIDSLVPINHIARCSKPLNTYEIHVALISTQIEPTAANRKMTAGQTVVTETRIKHRIQRDFILMYG